MVDSVDTRKIVSFCKLFRRYQIPGRKLYELENHSCTKNAKHKGGYLSTQCETTAIFRRSYE